MIEMFFVISSVFCHCPYIACLPMRYSTGMQDASNLPNDIDLCHAIIREQAAVIRAQEAVSFEQAGAIDDLVKSNDKLKKEVEELQLAVKKLLEGNRREKFFNPLQGLLAFPDAPELQAAVDAALEAAKLEAIEVIAVLTSDDKKTPKKVNKRSEAFPAHLRREIVEVPIPAQAQKLIDEGKLKIIRNEIREMLKFKVSELYVIQYHQAVIAHVHAPEQGITTVERPAGLGDEGRYDASVAATIINYKFGLHIPYYRIQDMFASNGWTPSRSTLDYLADLVNEATGPLFQLMVQRLKKSFVIGMDDTKLKLIIPNEIPKCEPGDQRTQRLVEKMLEAEREGKPSLNAKMWAYSGGADQPYDIFDFQVSRHRDGPAVFLEDYERHVMADCYSGNLSVVLARGSLMTRMACLSHARRKIFESRGNDPNASVVPLALIGQLYDIERRAVDWADAERREIRQRESKLIFAQLRTWIDGPVAQGLLPQSGLGKAINYLRNHWQALMEYLEDGRLPIDNNWVERLMKRVAVGRKNWLFIGSLRAGIRNANLMTFVASALRQDLDVQEYLTDVITQMNRGTASPEELLPDVWKQSHPEAVRTYRVEERRDKADRAQLKAARRRLVGAGEAA